MILLITPSAPAQQCADAANRTGNETIGRKNSKSRSRLREQTYTAAVIDQFLLETD